MELQKIRELIDVLMASDLAELEFSQGTHTLRLVRRSSRAAVPYVDPDSPAFITAETVQTQTGRKPAVGVDSDLLIDLVRSPLYGIVHLTASPDSPPFVQLGEPVHKGQVLCVVEAMKIFHEIKADRSGRVEAVLAEPAQEVESGAPLFRLVPAD